MGSQGCRSPGVQPVRGFAVSGSLSPALGGSAVLSPLETCAGDPSPAEPREQVDCQPFGWAGSRGVSKRLCQQQMLWLEEGGRAGR